MGIILNRCSRFPNSFDQFLCNFHPVIARARQVNDRPQERSHNVSPFLANRVVTRLLCPIKLFLKFSKELHKPFWSIFHVGGDMGTVISLTFEERRRTPRRQVHQIGMILAEPREAASYCLVTDRSDGGVRIRTRS